MVKELHQRGFGKLRITPSLSASGMHWRCRFDGAENVSSFASEWVLNFESSDPAQEIKLTAQELADAFINDNPDFLAHCKGSDEGYEKWYSVMLDRLEPGELPYAFSDYYSSTDFWRTSKGNKIKTYSNKER